MVYTVGRNFIKVAEFSGVLTNKSNEYTVEFSTVPVANSGILIYPNGSNSFRYHDIYLRCIDGTADVECEPFDIGGKKGIGYEGTYITDGDYLHLTFDFPTGSNKTMLLKNPRKDLKQSDIQALSELAINEDIFRNDFSEPTRGIKRALLIKSLIRDKSNSKYTFTVDTRRRLATGETFFYDLRRVLITGGYTFNVDLVRRRKWQWLTRNLPDSSFLDSKMYASAEALDVQITKFHLAIREVLHLPRIEVLGGTILDLLADQFHIDAYDAINFSDEEKRNLIRTSIAWHRIKGTPAAVEMVLRDAFKDLRIDEWFNYGGEPYYFRLWTTGYISTPERFKSFWNMFLDAKNVRSHLEKITIDLSPDEPINVYVGVAKVVSGTKKIGLPRPQNTGGNVYTGVIKIRTGTTVIGMHHNPF